MAAYSVVVKRSAEKEIEHLPTGNAADDEAGDYRVVYTIEDAIVTVTVVRVARRSDVQP